MYVHTYMAGQIATTLWKDSLRENPASRQVLFAFGGNYARRPLLCSSFLSWMEFFLNIFFVVTILLAVMGLGTLPL